MLIVFYISGHGLGHASRDLEVINVILERRPDARIVVRTSAPRWFFEASSPRSIALQVADVDTGVVQIDSLRLDEDETARCAAAFYRTFDTRVAEEAQLLTELGADLVLGDIPPLAFAAASRAGVPSIAIGNFTWDWIYAGYSQFERMAPGVIARIAAAYARATRVLRLPIHGGFETMAPVTRDIPLIARHAARPRSETRRVLGIDDDAVMVLASFGGYGLRLPYDEIARDRRFTLVVTEHERSGTSTTRGGRPTRDDRPEGRAYVRTDVASTTIVAPGDTAYPDIVAAADVVVTKPGYGIVSECIANDTALLYTERGRFAEHDVMVAEMPQLLRCRFIPQDDLLAGRWGDAIDALLDQTPPPSRPATNGADIAATEILALAARAKA